MVIWSKRFAKLSLRPGTSPLNLFYSFLPELTNDSTFIAPKYFHSEDIIRRHAGALHGPCLDEQRVCGRALLSNLCFYETL